MPLKLNMYKSGHGSFFCLCSVLWLMTSVSGSKITNQRFVFTPLLIFLHSNCSFDLSQKFCLLIIILCLKESSSFISLTSVSYGVTSLRMVPSNAHLLLLVILPSALPQWNRVGRHHDIFLLRLGNKRQSNICLHYTVPPLFFFSSVTHSREANMSQSTYGEAYVLTEISCQQPCWKWILQPQSSLQRTAAIANFSTKTSQQTQRQNHSAKALLLS